VVKDYVRIAHARGRETFVPLSHSPGHAQVDFGEAVGVIGGVRCKIHFFRTTPFKMEGFSRCAVDVCSMERMLIFTEN
jgi:hypothetical protein